MTAVLAILVLSSLPAQVQWDLGDRGVLSLADDTGPLARAVVYVHGPEWAQSVQDAGSASTQGDWLAGSFPMPTGSKGEVHYRERVVEKADRLEATYEVEFTEGSPLQAAYVSFHMPVARWMGKKVDLLPSGESEEFPADQDARRFSSRASALLCHLDNGRALLIGSRSGPPVMLEDMRRFGGQEYELRFILARESVAAGQKTSMTFTIANLPAAEARKLAEELTPRMSVDTSKPFALVGDDGQSTVGINRDTLGTIRASVHGPDWAWASQEACQWSSRQGTITERTLIGTLDLPNTGGKQARLYEKAAVDQTALVLTYRFTFPEAVTLNSYQVSCELPLAQWTGATVELAGEEKQTVTIGAEMGEVFLASTTVSAVTVRKPGLPELTIQTNEPTPLLIQDGRNWGGNSIELRFNFIRDDAGQQVAAGTTVEREFRVTSAPPLQAVADPSLVWDAYDQSTWIPFTLPWDSAPVDVSWLNEKPAGTHGKLTVRDGHFVFADGTPARFWGTCFSAGANFPTHEQSEAIARRLAALGVNIVRTHHADAFWAERNFFGKDSPDTRHFDPDSMDRFDYLIHCLKREGVYVYLDQLVNRKFTEADGVDAAAELPVCGKPYSNFDPKLIELQREFSRMIWEHVNPYTGMAYKDDPAIVLMEFANENDLFTQTVELEPYRTRLEEVYRRWAADNGVEVPDGPVDFRRRTDGVTAFFISLQRRYYEDLGRYLREEVGVQVPMTGSNWSRNAALLDALSVCDYTDSHAYWHHPGPDGSVGNTPAVRAVSPLVGGLSFNGLAGKPFFVSEWHEPWPNEWRAEISLYLAAVAALQGWDGLTVYTYAHTSERMPTTDYLSGAFEAFNDPAMFGLFPHAALIYRRGDVSTSDERWVIVIPEDRIPGASSLSAWAVPALRGTPDVHQVSVALRQAPAWADKVLSPDDDLFKPTDVLKSDTGELTASPAGGLYTIDTARTQAVLGFLAEAGDLQLSGLSVSCKTDFATIAASSLTDEPLASSRHVLISAVGRVENSGTRYDINHRRMVSAGKAPILCQPVEASLRLKTSQQGLRVCPISPDGKRGEALPATYRDGVLSFDLGPSARTIYYELVAGE